MFLQSKTFENSQTSVSSPETFFRAELVSDNSTLC